MVSTSQPNLFDSAMSSVPRMRAWMFSSVTSSLRPLNGCASDFRKPLKTGVIGSLRKSMPRFFASRRASSRVPREEKGEGMVTPVTFSRPSASTATAATSALSMPPESPMTTRLKPFLRT